MMETKVYSKFRKDVILTWGYAKKIGYRCAAGNKFRLLPDRETTNNPNLHPNQIFCFTLCSISFSTNLSGVFFFCNQL